MLRPELFQGPTPVAARIKTPWLVLLALATIVLWRVSAYTAAERGLGVAPMLEAARIMAQASQVIRGEKLARSLLQGPDIDPNQTGLIGPEWTETTTTLGDLQAKRTLTNPDVAAWLARLLDDAGLKPGDTVGVVLSGSFVGGNIAVFSALESLRLQPVAIASLGASMYGAADAGFTWLDMEAAIRSAGLWHVRSSHALLGGEASLARDLSDEARESLRRAASRNGVALLQAADFASTVQSAALALGLAAGGAPQPKLLINIGGAQAALGSCREAQDIAPGLIRKPIHCAGGTPGLIQRALDQGIPVLNVFRIRELAHRYGLPFDPVPLPLPGENPFVYPR